MSWLFAGLALLTGCIKTDVLRLETSLRPQTQPQSVRVLATEPTEPYVVIALVTVSSGERGVDALRERLVEKAAQLGGDAVLLGAESLGRTDKRQVLSGKVIAFKRSGS